MICASAWPGQSGHPLGRVGFSSVPSSADTGEGDRHGR